MGVFPPPSICHDPDAIRLWLVGVMVGLTVMGIALLVQAGVLWRRMTRVHTVWWQRLPLVLLLVWAGGCLFYAVQAFMDYHGMQPQASLLGCPPGVRCGMPLYCYPDLLGGPAQVALLGAVCLLTLSWLASSALARRLRTE
ncbi:MAG: hypothetical protein ACXWQ5_21670 [Ktedonobacterales bacterium]